MTWFCAALSAAGVLESVICSCLMVELAGYWLYRLVPITMLPLLGRHHGVLPTSFLRHDRQYRPSSITFKGATDERLSFGKIGFEGLAPSAILLIVSWGGYVPTSDICCTRPDPLGIDLHPINRKGLAVPMWRYKLTVPLLSLEGTNPGQGEAAFQ